MIAHNITISLETSRKLMIRAHFDRTTCEAGRGPRSEDERKQQRLLKELDSALSLRWDFTEHQYLVLYDYHGLVTVAWSFECGLFGKAYQNLKHKATLDARKLQEMLKAERDGQEQFVTDQIAEAGLQGGKDIHRMTTCKTTTDSVIDNDY